MSDNDHDILETGDLDADSGLEDFDTGGKTTFADAWRTNPMVKIGVVVGGLAVIVGGFMLFGGKSNPIAPSAMITSQSNVKEAPGGKVSELYAKAVNETNEKSVEDAIRNNTSSLPVPVGPSKGKVELDTNKESSEDPLERWRRIQEERTKKEQQAKVEPAAAPAPPPVDPYAQQKQNLSQSMAQQMQSVLRAQKLDEPKMQVVTNDSWLEQKKKAAADAAKADAETKATEAAKSAAATNPVEILLEPGRIEYAQLIIEANSDIPGPVLAELASGPLIGNRVLGSFQKADEYLVLKFDTVVVNGIGLRTDAIALDPKTSRVGIVTEVDRKYFTRVILPAAAAFISGIGGAIANSGSTTVAAGEGTVTTAQNDLNAKQEFFKGVEKASDKLGSVLEQDAQKVEVGVRVAAGTHIGILFTKAVTTAPANSPLMAAVAPTPSAPVAAPIMLQLAPQQSVAQQGAVAPSSASAGQATDTNAKQ